MHRPLTFVTAPLSPDPITGMQDAEEAFSTEEYPVVEFYMFDRMAPSVGFGLDDPALSLRFTIQHPRQFAAGSATAVTGSTR